MSYRTIRLKGNSRYEEAAANAALSPGHAIELMSTGKVRKNATQGLDGQLMVAIEGVPGTGGTPGNSVATAYAADDVVSYILPNKGDEFAGLIEPGSNYAKGARLQLNASGEFEAIASGKAVGVLQEAIDLTASGAVATLAAIRAI